MQQKLKQAFLILLGSILTGLSLDLFLIPLQIAAGGVSGMAILIQHLTGWDVGVLIFLINIPIFLLGWLRLNRSVVMYSLFGTVCLSLATTLFATIPPVTRDPFLAVVCGGAGMGCGIGLVLQAGGSTGGTDLLAMLLRKRFPIFSMGQFFLIIDGLVIFAAGLIFGRWEVILYSALTLFISTNIMDTMLAGVNYAKAVYIISAHAEEIAQGIYANMHRGVTGLRAVSLYQQGDKLVLLCVIRRAELPRLKQLVRDLDAQAFMIVSEAKEVLGNGFGNYNL